MSKPLEDSGCGPSRAASAQIAGCIELLAVVGEDIRDGDALLRPSTFDIRL